MRSLCVPYPSMNPDVHEPLSPPESSQDQDRLTQAAIRVLWRRILRWILFSLVWAGCFAAGYLTSLNHFRIAAFRRGWDVGSKGLASLSVWPLPEPAAEQYAVSALEVGIDRGRLRSPTGWYAASFSILTYPNPMKGADSTEADSVRRLIVDIQAPASTTDMYFLSKHGGLSRLPKH